MHSADWQEIALENAADVNPETLGVNTPPQTRIRYIDISSVTPGQIQWGEVNEIEFQHAPSRARRIVREGDSLFCTVRPALQAHASVECDHFGNLVCSTGFAVLRPRDLHARFLYHTLFSEYVTKYVRRHEIGSSYPAINEGDLQTLQLHAPTREVEQARVGHVLDTLDTAIRNVEIVVAKLRGIKAGLLQKLLTRGIGSDLCVRDPERDPFDHSSLGSLPASWEVAPLGQHTVLMTSGSRGWANYYAKAGALFLRIGNLTRRHINLRLDDCIFVRPPLGGEGYRTRVQAGDLLVSITADLGITAVIPEHFGEAYVNQHIALIRLDRAHWNPRWVANYLAAEPGQNQFRALNESGAKAGLSLPTVGNILVAKPTLEEQRLVVERLDAHEERLASENVSLAKLRALKRGLAEDLLTGRVRVKV